MGMDNFQIDVTGEGQDSLLDAIQIAIRHNAPGDGISGYRITETDGLVFLWEFDNSAPEVELPFRLDAKSATDFASRWLAAPNLVWPPKPNIDGDCGRGWRAYTGPWGQVGDNPYAVIAIQPVWTLIGK